MIWKTLPQNYEISNADNSESKKDILQPQKQETNCVSQVRGEKTLKVYEAIKKAGETISIRKIRSLTDVNHNTIRGAVQRLTVQGLIKRVGRGVYKQI